MTVVNDNLSERCQAALVALDQVLEERPNKVYDEVAEAARCVVRVRDDLIERRRAGDTSRQLRDRLDRVNSVLSMISGAEYPLVGIRWQRVKKARDALEEVLHIL